MTIAITEDRLQATLAFLKRLAARGRYAPTNKQIALLALKMGQQKYQPADRTIGIKWPKCEHGSVIVAELERRGLINVQRLPRSWRRITIVETGQVLEPRPRCLDGSTRARVYRSYAA